MIGSIVNQVLLHRLVVTLGRTKVRHTIECNWQRMYNSSCSASSTCKARLSARQQLVQHRCKLPWFCFALFHVAAYGRPSLSQASPCVQHWPFLALFESSFLPFPAQWNALNNDIGQGTESNLSLQESHQYHRMWLWVDVMWAFFFVNQA